MGLGSRTVANPAMRLRGERLIGVVSVTNGPLRLAPEGARAVGNAGSEGAGSVRIREDGRRATEQAQGAGRLAGEGASEAVVEVGKGAGFAVEDVGEGADQAAGGAGRAGDAAEPATAQEAEAGRRVLRVVDETGDIPPDYSQRGRRGRGRRPGRQRSRPKPSEPGYERPRRISTDSVFRRLCNHEVAVVSEAYLRGMV